MDKVSLKEAGMNLEDFSAHSVRGASASAAFASGAPLDLILKTVGWLNCKTFEKHYHKPIIDTTNVITAILSLVE